jgi:hypothetical protein
MVRKARQSDDAGFGDSDNGKLLALIRRFFTGGAV